MAIKLPGNRKVRSHASLARLLDWIGTDLINRTPLAQLRKAYDKLWPVKEFIKPRGESVRIGDSSAPGPELSLTLATASWFFRHLRHC
jgi:hypothetical protein